MGYDYCNRDVHILFDFDQDLIVVGVDKSQVDNEDHHMVALAAVVLTNTDLPADC